MADEEEGEREICYCVERESLSIKKTSGNCREFLLLLFSISLPNPGLIPPGLIPPRLDPPALYHPPGLSFHVVAGLRVRRSRYRSSTDVVCFCSFFFLNLFVNRFVRDARPS